MAHRRPIVAGNWKMNCTAASAVQLATGVHEQCGPFAGSVDVGVCPTALHLAGVLGALCDAGSPVLVGAQNCYFEPAGAFTGEVSATMLADHGAKACIIGHSERRHVFGEPDQLINRKTKAVLAAGLHCILCIGELLEEREAGHTDAVNDRQLRAGLEGVSKTDAERLVIAYEPVWAIGTGKTATPDDAQAAHAAARAVLADVFDRATAEAIRIQYGGSMKPANAADLLAQPDVDGGLIGGASLEPDQFAAIVEAAATQAGAAASA